MSSELDQPVSVVIADAALSALLCLFHAASQTNSLRISQRIYCHLEALSQREDLSEMLQKTCDELSDAWQMRLDRQRARMA